jgi:hypothetical protein
MLALVFNILHLISMNSSAVSSIGNDNAYFGVDDVGLMVEVSN